VLLICSIAGSPWHHGDAGGKTATIRARTPAWMLAQAQAA